MLRGHLQPDGAGCRLVATIGWHPLTCTMVVLWAALAMAVASASSVLHDLQAGTATWSGEAANVGPIMLEPTFMVALTAGASALGAVDGDYLQAWVRTVLEAPTGGRTGATAA